MTSIINNHIAFVTSSPDQATNLLWKLPIPKGSFLHGIVIGHNAEGKALPGLTTHWEREFPNEAMVYRMACESGYVQPGQILPVPCFRDQRILFLVAALKTTAIDGFTQELLHKALTDIVFNASKWHLTSVAFHKMGVGKNKTLNLQSETVIKALYAIADFLTMQALKVSIVVSDRDVVDEYGVHVLPANDLIHRAHREGGQRFILSLAQYRAKEQAEQDSIRLAEEVLP